MKKLICLLLVTIMILSFSACKKDDTTEDSKNDFWQEKEDNTEEDITYPILFLRDGSLYWIKDYGESPILVDNGTFLDFYDVVKVNPVNPNEIIRADYTWAKEYYLNTAPDTEGDMLDNISESISNSRILDIGYTPNGSIYSYKNSHNLTFDEIPMYISNVSGYCFDKTSPKCTYIITEEKEASLGYKTSVGYIDTETGWYETTFIFPDDFGYIQNILDFFDNKMYFRNYNYIDERIELCSYSFLTDEIVVIDYENEYAAYSQNLNAFFRYSPDGKGEFVINNKTYPVNYHSAKEYFNYIKIVMLDDNNIILAYTNDKNNEIIQITSKKEKELFSGTEYQFVQPLNSKELLLLETTDFGTTNLVAYNIKSEDFTIIYENFKGNIKDIIITYNTHKWIYNYSYNPSDYEY
ncbi:MAG: hypothetical protein IJZ58_08985 [Oscillospiraceae bacterium]|nr:hypothetical protein [Oscillospiraceae bacterium]